MEKLEHYKKYGWTTSEKNLATLPDAAPQAAKDLAKWLTLEGRQQSLKEWLGCVGPNGRIHGKFWHIGAWTQRMSHSNPNQANIFSAFTDTPKTPVEEIKAKYDWCLRNLWQAEEGKWLVGTDAEGIQLRILTHYMKSETWKKAILAGKKEDETDIHSMNRKALGTTICRDRDTAKTFIYAWILGASIPKVAEILDCSVKQASSANNQFLDAFPELRRLKQHKIPTDASRGYFIGLDGRKVMCNSEHLMLAGYLQNGEATIMKHANVLWRQTITRPYKQVDFVHDEWQTECDTEEDANWIGLMQSNAIAEVGKKLNLFCPLAGKYVVGRTWAQTH